MRYPPCRHQRKQDDGSQQNDFCERIRLQALVQRLCSLSDGRVRRARRKFGRLVVNASIVPGRERVHQCVERFVTREVAREGWTSGIFFRRRLYRLG